MKGHNLLQSDLSEKAIEHLMIFRARIDNRLAPATKLLKLLYPRAQVVGHKAMTQSDDSPLSFLSRH